MFNLKIYLFELKKYCLDVFSHVNNFLSVLRKARGYTQEHALEIVVGEYQRGVFRNVDYVRNVRMTFSVRENLSLLATLKNVPSICASDEKGNHVSRKTSCYAKKCNTFQATTVTGRLFDIFCNIQDRFPHYPSYLLISINVTLLRTRK